jgi:hypothetical protein
MGPGSHVGFPISGNFTFSSFFLKPQNRFEPNLAEMFIGWSYTRFVFLVLIGNPAWLPGPITKNKNLVYDHPMKISAKFDSNLFCGFRKKDENVKFP